MNLQELNDRIEKNNLYKFSKEHQQVIKIVEGIFILILLISLNFYVINDHFLKKQIAKNCGYVDSTYKCVCEKHYVDDWESMQLGLENLNLSLGLGDSQDD